MGAATEQHEKAFVVKSEIHLQARTGDNVIDARELRQFDLFRRMKNGVSIEKFPGSIILRRYAAGEVVFQQGQSGGTAFYIPSAEDLVRIEALEKGQEPPENPVVDPKRDRHILSALIIPSTKKPRPRGLFQRWFGVRSSSQKGSNAKLSAIPNDGPSDIDFQTREAPLYEGNLFGEMSCISFMPRSATVVTRVACRLLEFNRNVFDQVRDDKNHQEQVEKEYRRRTLDTHLRQFELFKDLNESQIQLLKDNVSLEIVPPGKVICEEGEKWSDSDPLDVFIVRNGVVQVIVNASLSVRSEDISDWAELCRQIGEAKPDPKVEALASSPPPANKAASPASTAAKPLSPLEKMRQQKADATAGTGVTVETIETPPSKPSPLDLIRAKQTVATEKAGTSPAVLSSQHAASEQTPPAKLSPLEQIRAKQAAAAAKAAVPANDGTPTGEGEAPAVPTAKLSPLEQIRAKQAAAAAKAAAPANDGTPTGEGEAPAVPPAKLSPLEQIRAKQAAAAAKAAAPANDGTPTGEGEAPAAPPAKLSPLEQIRAKQAAAAAKAAAPANDGTRTGEGEAPAVPPAKLSPLEQIRAKQATAGAKAAAPATNDPVEASGNAPTTSPAPKASPLEMMRARQAANASSAAASGAVPPMGSQPPDLASATKSPQQPATKSVPLIRKPTSAQPGPPDFVVQSWLNDLMLQTVKQVARGELTGESLTAAQTLIINALNQLSENRDFLGSARIVADIYSKPAIVRKTGSFPKGFKGIAREWTEMELRTAGRAAMSEIFPKGIRPTIESSGPPRVLAYLSRGECIGEIAVVRGTKRNATCIAYNHPTSELARDFGNVELVRIRGTVFRQLMSESPQLDRQVKLLADKRTKESEASDDRNTEPDVIASTEFQQMGLFQGSKLLVIDLDSCTRCGDCVQACVDTHDDGVSRLFLDGPRYDRFLVPSACRNCLNPVCMIGCPVGSIGRGENGQIEIYDWCIGCSACADQCPYDSIQMHDIGLIPEESSGWLYANRRSLQDDWHRERRLGSGWMQGESPFRWQGDFLRQWSTGDQALSKTQPLRLCFRHEFRLPKKSNTQRYRISINDARRKSAMKKILVKMAEVTGVWLNGNQLDLSGQSIELTAAQFSQGNNLLSVEVELESPAEYGQFVLSACLDAIPDVGSQALEVLGKDVRSEMDLVTRKAAVCDLCSHIPSQQPACVSSCPHDAAIRVNPMINFPM